MFGFIYGKIHVEEGDLFKYGAIASNLIIDASIFAVIISIAAYLILPSPPAYIELCIKRIPLIAGCLIIIAFILRRIYAVMNHKCVSRWKKK